MRRGLLPRLLLTVASLDLIFLALPTLVVLAASFTSGNIVTNAHVVQDANVITVWLASGEQVEAETVGSAPNYDIAGIRLNGRPIRSAFDLTDQLEDVGIGQSIRLTVKRDGKTVKVEVEIVDIDRKF